MKRMSEDAKAILLLCGHLGGEGGAKPLDQREYNNAVRWLVNAQLRPADLLDSDRLSELARQTGLAEERLAALLKRGVKLGFAVEEWNRSGIWVVCRSDPEYPARYRDHLKDKAPPILYCAGDQALLHGGGLAIVGSRNVDSEGERFARDIAERCARQGVPVVSGGARGVDQIAMSSALESGGVVAGVLTDSLLRRSVSRDARGALADGRLLLLSPYHPKARFTVGTAMGRNKLIYALSEYGLVVSSDFGKGGTWEGAKEELKRKPGRPVFVRTGPNVPKGNLELLELGAKAFPEHDPEQDLVSALEKEAQKTSDSLKEKKSFDLPEMIPLPLFPSGYEPARSARPAKQAMLVRERGATLPASPSALPETVLDAVQPLILQALDKPRTSRDLAGRLKVSKPQMDAWLRQLSKAKAIKERMVRKSRKFSAPHSGEELNLS